MRVEAVLRYQIAVTEAAHNVVLLHLLRCMEPMLAQNVRQELPGTVCASGDTAAGEVRIAPVYLKPLWPENQKKRVKRHTPPSGVYRRDYVGRSREERP